jgi:Na+/proline symporter
MLYQIYLGYKIGWWGLLPQAFWAFSFVLLARYAQRLSASTGLHGFLGHVFSPSTRVLAAICSVIGLSLQIGWEYSVAKSAFSGLTTPPLTELANYIVVGAVFAAATVYTLLGGLRSNSITDLIQNILKVGCFVVLGFLAYSALHAGNPVDWSLADPKKMIVELTFSGLVANLAFSLAWQFGDMSTWQTAVSAKEEGDSNNTASALKSTAFLVFIAPGLLGTVIGIIMSGQSGLDSNTLLPTLLHSIGSNPIFLVILVVALVAAAMSFVDGIILAIGYTAVTDLILRKTVDKFQLLKVPTRDEATVPEYQRALSMVLASSRIALVVAVIVGTAALDFLGRHGVSLFDQVYVVTVAQLSLVGPAIQGLRGWQSKRYAGVSAIVAGLLSGFGLVVLGVALKNVDIGNLAPVGAIVSSWFTARLMTKRPMSVTIPPRNEELAS